MNDYKHNLICLVQKTPLLRDPRDKDCKNKDQRKQVWKKIDEKLPPPVEGCTAKDTWTSLTRSYNNALQGMKSKSGDGAGNSKPLMFMKSMSFLKVVKEKRSTTGNLGSSHDIAEDLDESASSIDDSSIILEQAARGSGIFDQTNDTSQADDEDPLTATPPRPSTPSGIIHRKASSNGKPVPNVAQRNQKLPYSNHYKEGWMKNLLPVSVQEWDSSNH